MPISAGNTVPGYQAMVCKVGGISGFPMASNGMVVALANLPNAATNEFNVQVTVRYKTKSGTVVDIATNIPNISISLTAVLQGSNYVATGCVSKECLDPRLNHDGGMWGVPKVATGSMGAENSLTTNAWSSNFANAKRDKDIFMYVANHPVKTAGELGYLLSLIHI